MTGEVVRLCRCGTDPMELMGDDGWWLVWCPLCGQETSRYRYWSEAVDEWNKRNPIVHRLTDDREHGKIE